LESSNDTEIYEDCVAIRRSIFVVSDHDGLPEVVFNDLGAVCFGRLYFPIGTSSARVMSVVRRNDSRIELLLTKGLTYLFMCKATGKSSLLRSLPRVARSSIASLLVDQSVVCDLVGCYRLIVHYGQLCPCVRAQVGRWPLYYATSAVDCDWSAHWSRAKQGKRVRALRDPSASFQISRGLNSGVRKTGRFRKFREQQRRQRKVWSPPHPSKTSPPRLLKLFTA
jgi:hypothetical protein